MAVSTRWVDLRHPFFRATGMFRGASMPDGQEITETFAFVLMDDGVVVIEGTEFRLRRLLRQLTEALDNVVENPQGITMEDIQESG